MVAVARRRGLRSALLLTIGAATLWVVPTGPASPLAARLWCGERSQTDRPDARSALQVHVVYAVPADGEDRFAQRVDGIVRDLTVVTEWWEGQDSTRAPRFDLAESAACSPELELARLDVSSARLPQGGTVYSSAFDPYGPLLADLNRPPLSFDDPDKKYLVFYDGPVSRPQCGTSSRELDGGRLATAVIYLASVCGASAGQAGWLAVVIAHELIHSLGALPPAVSGQGAPHTCSLDPGHPCDSASDILFPSGKSTDTLQSKQLDVGRDDYYDHSGSWWDVRDSLFLARLDTDDAEPPVGPATITATSRETLVHVSWPQARDDTPVAYRVYRNGRLFLTTSELREIDSGLPGQTFSYGVRAVDGAGHLGPLRSLRFTIGLGVVNEAGVLVDDTVPPPQVTGFRAVRGRASLTLRWSPVSDPGGLKGYRLTRNGRRHGGLVSRPLRTVSLAGARARWNVSAVDRAGNVGDPASLRVSA